jgi:hypothetical protein
MTVAGLAAVAVLTAGGCSTAITGTGPNWMASKQACQARECVMPSATVRSDTSKRCASQLAVVRRRPRMS